MNDTESAEALIAEALQHPHGDFQLDLLERAAQLAQTSHDWHTLMSARIEFVQAAIFAKRAHRALPVFAQLQADSDRYPERFPETRQLHLYKWIINHITGTPSVSRAQIDAIFEDVCARLRRHGASLRTAYDIRAYTYLRTGETDKALEAYHRHLREPADSYSNCKACDVATQVHFLLVQNMTEAALEAAAPILSGRLSCSGVPADTYARLLLPLLELGRPDQAADYHRKGMALLARRPTLRGYLDFHLRYLAYTDNAGLAPELISRHVPAVMESRDQESLFDILLGSLFPLTRLAANGEQHFPYPLPQELGFKQKPEQTGYALAEVIDVFQSHVLSLADAFDQRNGTRGFHSRVDELRELGTRLCGAS